MLRDLQHAFRTLRRGPLFALAVVMTLALGIGVNATVFVLVDRLLFNPPPVRSIEDLVAVSAINTQDPSIRNPVSYPNFEDLRAASESLSDLVAHTWIEVALSDGERPEQVLGQFVSSNFFDGLGVGAAAGRTFGENPGREVILSHRLWQRRYGGDRGVIGRTVQLNTLPFTVIGIAPRGFHGPSMATAYDLWVATTTSRDILGSEDFVQRRAWGIYELIGRLAPGATLERAAEELTVVASRLAQQYPEDSRHFGVAVRSFSEATLPAGQRAIFLRAAVLLSVLALVVLVVTCANLTNLFLTRAEGRRGELAIRQSLGASRGTLIRQMLAESLLLAVAGGVLGLALSVAGTRFLWSLRPPTLENGSLALGIDGRGLLFALALSILAALWFGLIPAIRAARGEVTAGLRGGAEEVRGSARGFALRDALLVFQIGLCLVALVVSGLFLRSLRSIQETPAGFVPGDVVLMSFDASSVGLDTDGGRVLFRRVLETARRQPGVRRAALAQSRPLVAPLVQRRILPSDQPDESGSALQVLSNTVSDGYFSTLEIPLLQGREFSELDNLERPRVAILNATLAERLWPDRPALGRSLRFEGGEESLEVVGIVGDIKYNTLTEGAQPYLYFPVGQDYYPATTLHAKTTVKPSDLARAIQEVEPKLALTGVMTAGEQVASSLRAPRLASFLLGLFAVVTLLLAVLGTYALAAHSVRRRRPEIGLRIALGARRQALLLTLTRRTLVLTGIGLVLGLLAAYLFVPTAASLLHGLGALDPASFGAASIILALTAVAATLVPAYRALRCDPATILKGSR